MKECIPWEARALDKICTFKQKIHLKVQKNMCFFISFQKHPNIFFSNIKMKQCDTVKTIYLFQSQV